MPQLTITPEIEQTQAALDVWVESYNNEREHQAIGDVAPIKRFELGRYQPVLEIHDGEIVSDEDKTQTSPERFVVRRIDAGGRASILKHRYHVGRYLAGEIVEVRGGKRKRRTSQLPSQRLGHCYPRQTTPRR